MFNDMLPARFELVVLAIVLPLLLTKMVAFDHYEVGQWIIVFTGLVIVVWTARTSGRYILIAIYLLIISTRHISFETIANTILLLGLTTFALIFMSSIINLIPNLRYWHAGTYRNSFGIQYPTDFAAHVLYLLLTYVVVKKGRFYWYDWLLSIILVWFVWTYCNARLDTILIIVLLFLLLVYKMISYEFKMAYIIAWLSVGSMLLGAVLSLGLSYYYNYNVKWLRELNVLLSGRLRLGREAFNRYTPQLFGQIVRVNGLGGSTGLKHFLDKLFTPEYFFIDSSYLTMLLTFGVILSIALLVRYTWFIWREVSQQEYLLPLLIAVVAISCIVDQHLLDISYNIFLLALFANTKSFRKIS
ncbi:polysaccharide biosynthesis protein [Loigolactobacillus coryniformis subsp. coryniformis]